MQGRTYVYANTHVRTTLSIGFPVTAKPVLSGHSKIDKTILMTNDSLMKVKSIADAPLGAFCNTFDLHLVIIGLENQFLVFFLSGLLRQILQYLI